MPLEKSIPKVLHVGTDRFAFPLAPTDAKRFSGINEIAPNYMLAFSKSRWPRRFYQNTQFYLLPDIPFQRLRQAMFLAACFVAVICLSLFKGVRIAVSQSIYDALPLIIARKVLHLTNRRICVIVQVHGDWEEGAFLNKKLPRLAAPLIRAVSRFVLHNADVVRVISGFTEDKVKPYLKEGTPCVIFPGFTDIDFFLEDY